MKLFTNNKTYTQFQFDKEIDFEREVVLNSKQFFGSNSVYIDAKRKIDTKNLGGSIPDGYLFDFSDKENPEFYIVEVELSSHDFYRHIFPQITKFFGFYKNPKSQNDLVEKIFLFVNNDSELKKEFKKYLGDKELYKFIKDTIEKSQNILLVIDGDKKELPEIMDTYSDTWGKMVRLVLIKKFINSNDVIYTMHPDFENIEFSEIEDEITADSEEVEYNEAYHFEGVAENVRSIYNTLKDSLSLFDSKIIFNPQKHYISFRKERNFAFFISSRKKVRLVVMQNEDLTRQEIKTHQIKSLTAGVQKFWNGPSTAIIIENIDNIEEIILLLKKIASQ